jgi:hypothetical protein
VETTQPLAAEMEPSETPLKPSATAEEKATLEPTGALAMGRPQPPAGETGPADTPLKPSSTTQDESTEPAEQIPLLRELPPETQQKLSDLDINGHVYNEDPSKSFVFIKSRSYRVGDRIGENGPLLQKIIPEGVIIDYGDGRARLLVGK